MATWQLFRDGNRDNRGTEVNNLIDIKYVASTNPFGDYVIAQIEDNKGNNFSNFEFGTRLSLFVTPDGGTETREFVGYAVERRENDQNGQDLLEVTGYTFDQFLRRNDVSNDQSGKLVSQAIEDIIDKDTPIATAPALIEVVDDIELRRSLKGKRVETALQILSSLSADEAFEVNNFGGFEFGPREGNHVDRGIDNTQWFNYDIPERGQNAINEVEVRFDDGNRGVVIDNAEQKLDLTESLDFSFDIATQRARINRPNITNLQDAEIEGQQFLRLKNVTLTGEVTTFGLFDAEPGDTINIEIVPRGIDAEFIITKIEYNWSQDQTILSIVENRGFDDDLLTQLEEKTEQIDLRDTTTDVVDTKVISTDISVALTADERSDTTPDAIRTTTTNDGVDAVASGWANLSSIDGFSIVVGDTATSLSRSDSDLENQINSFSASPSFNSTDGIAFYFAGQITVSGVKEIGLKDASGTLLTRTIFENPVSFSDDSIFLAIDVSNTSVNKSIITNTGIETVLEILTGVDSVNGSNRYAVGNDQTTPTISDTSLTNQVKDTKLNRTEVQNLDTPAEFNNAIDIPSDSPVTVDQLNGAITVDPVGYVTEAENVPSSDRNAGIFNDTANLSNGQGLEISQSVDNQPRTLFVKHRFTVNQDIPAGELFCGIYANLDNFDGELVFSFDGKEYLSPTFGGVTVDNTAIGTRAGVNSQTLQAGTQHTLEVRGGAFGSSGGGKAIIDAMYAYDDRSGFNITRPSGNAFDGDAYEEPELFPEKASVTLPEFRTRRKINELEAVQSWNNTNTFTAITLNIGDEKSRTIFNPSLNSSGRIRESVIATNDRQARFGNVEITLSRFNDAGDDTFPKNGDEAQRMSFHIANANPDSINRSDIGQVTTRASFESAGFDDFFNLRESGQLADADLLTHSIFANIEPGFPDSDNIVPVERLTFIPE